MSARFLSAFLSAAALCTSLGPALAADPQSSLDAAGHHLAVVSEGDTIHRVTVDGKPVFTDPADERLGLTGPYSGQGKTYVLLAEESGGNGCEVVYQAMDLTRLPVKISPVFGNCGGAEALVRNGALHVTTGAYTGRPVAGSPLIAGESVTYQNGRLVHGHGR